MTRSDERRVATIEAWMKSNLQSGGFRHFDDLHVDRISDSWRNPESWIRAGIEALRLSLQIRNKHAPNFSIALAFPLNPASQLRAPDFRSVKDLKQALDKTPPSIYLFERGSEPWAQPRLPNSQSADATLVQKLTSNPLLELAPAYSCYYIEFQQTEFGGYSKSLILAA